MSGALTGVRILDLSTVIPGPWAAQTLGDMGADVIKIEAPGGDTTRQLGPKRHANMGTRLAALTTIAGSTPRRRASRAPKRPGQATLDAVG